MHSRLLHENAGARTYALILETGDEAAACLEAFGIEQRLAGSSVSGLGALESATLAWWDTREHEYVHAVELREQVEVLSLLGNFALDEHGKAKLHAHLVVGKRDGTALGGHLLRAVVRPTLEIIITESPAHLQRRHDAASGLPLIQPS